MDIYRIIDELNRERDHITRIIESLETMSGKNKTAPKRRGRKSMDSAARQEVSERMRRYWAKRRTEKSAGASAAVAMSTAA